MSDGEKNIFFRFFLLGWISAGKEDGLFWMDCIYMDGLEKLYLELKQYYFAEFAMWLAELCTIVIGIIYVRGQKTGRMFLLYLIFDFFILNLGFYIISNEVRASKQMVQFISLGNSLVGFVEMAAYCYFFSIVVENKVVKKISRLAIISLLCFLIFITMQTRVFTTWNKAYSEKIFSASSHFILLLLSISYFFELLNARSEIDLFKRPSFWIATGIFFYALVCIPYQLIDVYLIRQKSPYKITLSIALYVVPFIINFFFLAKAFLCRKALTI